MGTQVCELFLYTQVVRKQKVKLSVALVCQTKIWTFFVEANCTLKFVLKSKKRVLYLSLPQQTP